MRSLLFGLILFVSIVRPAAASCPEIEHQRRQGLMSSIATLIQESARLTGQSAPGAEVFQNQLMRGDPQLDALSCKLLTSYPTLEPLMAETLSQLAGTSLPHTAPNKSAKGIGLCLSRGEFAATIGVHYALNTVSIGIDGFCRSTSCVPGACIAICGNLPLVTTAMAPLEAILETSAYTCLADHFGSMNDWAQGSLGAQLKGASSLTLSQLRARTSGELLPLVSATQEDFGRESDLEGTQAVFAERLDQANAEIDAIRTGLTLDEARRAGFQDRLDRLQLQRRLGDSREGLPLLLTLPGSAGGRLEAVREVVADAINASLTANLPEGMARILLRSGDAHYNAGRYAQAASDYRLAYQELLP